jgi:hypothetical protein
MITIDNNLLTSLGITMPANQEEDFLDYFYTSLEERVAWAITELLTDEEFDELLDLEQRADDATISNWINAKVPDVSAVIQDEFDILLGELAENADSLISA